MRVIVADDYEQLSQFALQNIIDILRKKPDAWMGMTTGNTPQGLYARLVQEVKEERLPIDNVKVVSTEEYLGVPPDHDMSLHRWLHDSFLEPCGIGAEQVLHIPGDHEDPSEACRHYDKAIEAHGGLDVIIEGIGSNGHIGFNEPGSSRDSGTRIVKLARSTLNDNYHYWNREAPAYGITIGMRQVLGAKQVLLLASGLHKAAILKAALQGPVGRHIPASWLQKLPHVTVIADRAAATGLSS